jgi:hypothetical protein
MYDKEYSLVNVDHVAALLRELYNWRTYAVENVAPQFKTGDKRLAKLCETLYPLQSLNSK